MHGRCVSFVAHCFQFSTTACGKWEGMCPITPFENFAPSAPLLPRTATRTSAVLNAFLPDAARSLAAFIRALAPSTSLSSSSSLLSRMDG